MALKCKGRVMAMTVLLTVSEMKVGSVPPLPSVALGQTFQAFRMVSYSVQWEWCVRVCVCMHACVCTLGNCSFHSVNLTVPHVPYH